jgi:hypothetical protein
MRGCRRCAGPLLRGCRRCAGFRLQALRNWLRLGLTGLESAVSCQLGQGVRAQGARVRAQGARVHAQGVRALGAGLLLGRRSSTSTCLLLAVCLVFFCLFRLVPVCLARVRALCCLSVVRAWTWRRAQENFAGTHTEFTGALSGDTRAIEGMPGKSKVRYP